MENKKFLVTGASRGLGFSISRELAKRGVTVIALGRSSKNLEASIKCIKSIMKSSFAVECDLADLKSISSAINLIKNRVTKIDGLVHNAGIISPIKQMFISENSDWLNNLTVNIIGVQRLTKGLYKAMRSSYHCRVTTVTSGAAKEPMHSWSSYCVSKAALEMWSRCLALEGRKDGISSISISPGIIDTDMQHEIRSTSANDFPSVSSFIDNFKEGKLRTADEVSQKFIPLILNHSYNQSGKRFDIKDL